MLADRGLYAKWLFEAIVELKWHPFLRVNSQGWFRPDNWYHWQPFSHLVPAKGRRWDATGDMVTEDLNPILASVCQGDLSLIKIVQQILNLEKLK